MLVIHLSLSFQRETMSYVDELKKIKEKLKVPANQGKYLTRLIKHAKTIPLEDVQSSGIGKSVKKLAGVEDEAVAKLATKYMKLVTNLIADKNGKHKDVTRMKQETSEAELNNNRSAKVKLEVNASPKKRKGLETARKDKSSNKKIKTEVKIETSAATKPKKKKKAKKIKQEQDSNTFDMFSVPSKVKVEEEKEPEVEVPNEYDPCAPDLAQNLNDSIVQDLQQYTPEVKNEVQAEGENLSNPEYEDDDDDTLNTQDYLVRKTGNQRQVYAGRTGLTKARTGFKKMTSLPRIRISNTGSS